ncbi:uncharacterized protein LOC106092016 isoform X4 [Stomoxys calcitrans]|uniref:uncharacterized protein LOC106092016 isoform X4 n=1 Tax=Stomoxys calcitrans TaxID=35570 RepID=UPI0027E36994|nr:uncharacterized protein LOC106092016 isoform X4 [Stomoxys calcitrans]
MEKNKLRQCIGTDVKNGNAPQAYDTAIKSNFLPELFPGHLRLQQSELNKQSSKITDSITSIVNEDINSSKILNENISKDTNFECEEEWDISGIPEILNELDADIEKSLKANIYQKFGCEKTDSKCKASRKRRIINQDGTFHENGNDIVCLTKVANPTSKLTEVSISALSETPFGITNRSIPVELSFQLNKVSVSHTMSSQGGNSSSTSAITVSGGISNANNNQSAAQTLNSNKLNSKMSIDHQATLDKGLKMKIKRTKPGTKSSEAKHEIVKATEQLQNGVVSGVVGTCSNNASESSTTTPGSNPISLACQNNFGTSATQSNPLPGGSKKNACNSGNNTFPSGNGNGGNIVTSAPLAANITNSSTVTSSKRSSSGHRRDKIKEKSSHSIRNVNDKNIGQNNEKDLNDKNICNCNISDSTTSCNSSTCTRRNEGNVQRLPHSNVNSTVVPPGVFIPSSETSSSAATLLSVPTTEGSSPVISHSSTISGTANTPGPPNRDCSGSNIKISSHIAAQLAAVAASNNADIKLPITSTPSSQTKQTSHSISVAAHINKSNVSTTPIGANLSPNSLADDNLKSPPTKRAKHNDYKVPEMNTVNKETVDICVGTSVGTITEPDCLGPCEPGTSVTLEGIVWHETEGGVLVVNVTWRGKTYVGTLLDCTRHDWAPPRFCDSPSDELDSRTPKGRAKRGRAITAPDLSNFTETRSSIYFSHPHVHSKLRNGTAKGGRGTSRSSNVTEKNNGSSSVSSGNGGSTPSTSPTSFLPPRAEKRKSKDEPSSPTNVDNDFSNCTMINASGIAISTSGGANLNQPQSLINPVTGLNVQISTKRCKPAVPCAISPVLLECPEQDCSKKYKHANGLRYHQSHAHGNVSIVDDDSIADIDEPIITPSNSPVLITIPVESEVIENVGSIIIDRPSALKVTDSIKLEDTETSPTLISTNTTEPEKTLLKSTSCGEICKIATEKVLASSQISSDTSNMCQAVEDLDKKGSGCTPSTSVEESDHLNNALKCGVLRFGQADSKENDISLLNLQLEDTSNKNNQEIACHSIASDSEGTSSQSMGGQMNKEITQSPKQQTINNDTLKIDTGPHQETNQISDEYNTSNITSRDEVQSPAYSDISDDSTPVNDQQLEKVHQAKNADIAKKSPDVVAGCSTSQTTIASPLGGYGMYQFYQQQQFLAQQSAEQQSNKNNSSNNIVQPSLPATCTSQQTTNNAEGGRKDPPLDLMTKSTTSPSPQDSNKDGNQPQTNINSPQTANNLSLGAGALNSSIASKSHFYAFNYMSPSYQFNVDQNYVPVSIVAEDGKSGRHGSIVGPSEQLQPPIQFKDDREKEGNSPNDNIKVLHQQQITPSKIVKSEPTARAENLETKGVSALSSQVSHVPLNNKDLPAMGSYSNLYQRHPMALASQQLSREEELRRYYIFSDQQRRQSSTVPTINLINQQTPGCANQNNQQQCKEDQTPMQANIQGQQQVKIKSNASLSMINNTSKLSTGTKDNPKQKEDELKAIKQEGQKPTMETQGPPPPPTSQYFLHPSYMAPTPFGFDPNHPMYRNVLMPPTPPYNTAPYHLTMPRYHAPEDLSRNTGTKALDVLHHAASQYYTTHKIHELSERALKSPNSSSSNGSTNVKASISSPTIGTNQHSNITANSVGHHSTSSQSSSTQLTHNLSSQTISTTSNKQEIMGQKSHTGSSGVVSVSHEPPKQQTSTNSSVVSNSSAINTSGGGADSRSPPPQRHVHTHHHTHVGLGYPMYPAPYGAFLQVYRTRVDFLAFSKMVDLKLNFLSSQTPSKWNILSSL